MVQAVDGSVVRHFGAAESGQRGEHVDPMNDFVAYALGRNFSGPAHQEGDANSPFERREILASPRAGPAIPGACVFGAVVAGENDDGVLFDPGFVNRGEYLPDVVIHFCEHVGPVAVTRFAGEFWIRQRREVRLGECDKGKEGFVGIRLPCDEIGRTAGDFGVDQTALRQIVVFQLVALFALASFENFLKGGDFPRITDRCRP